jgi:methylglutaconyl-CoA hydratase
MLSGAKFNAELALKNNMLTEIVDSHEELELKSQLLIKQLLLNSPKAMQQIKELLKNYKNKDYKMQCIEAIAKIRTSEQGQEGLKSFLNKTQPSWIKND